MDSIPDTINRETPVMPQAVQPQDEPDWVKRLREDGFDVRGGEGNLPEEPEASFAPCPVGVANAEGSTGRLPNRGRSTSVTAR